MDQNLFDWLLIIGRWTHITVAVTWIGTSIFFMWLDRSFEKFEGQSDASFGELWMVHGGGFYRVEKLKMGPTPVPNHLHWFKWESYWTWMSGMYLLVLIFYTGNGTYLLDESVKPLTFLQGASLGAFSIFGSWFFYDQLWESKFSKRLPTFAHSFTMLWVAVMAIILCNNLSGRAAYIHIGAMLGTWMAGNVFMRIIPRQLKMVEASKKGEEVNQEWALNAKARSTHNTYFTLPVIFIMFSNHFPSTYGHDWNWFLLILICASGAAIRQYFVSRLKNPPISKACAIVGIALLIVTAFLTRESDSAGGSNSHSSHQQGMEGSSTYQGAKEFPRGPFYNLSGTVTFEGQPPEGKLLSLPGACARQYPSGARDTDVLVNNGKLQNVLVRIVKGHERYKHELPANLPEVEIDQRGCLYRPRTVAARVGQKVTFINSDPIFHNVKSVAKQNKKFNMAMPKKDQRNTRIFERPELLQSKCSVHPWMTSNIAIFDHPWFAVTSVDGTFEITDLPAGNYTVEFWHETLGHHSKDVTISDDKTLSTSFSL